MNIKKLCSYFACVILTTTLFVTWVIYTKSGLKFFVATTKVFIPGTLNITSVNGNLASLELTDLNYTTPNNYQISIKNFKAKFNLKAIITKGSVIASNVNIVDLQIVEKTANAITPKAIIKTIDGSFTFVMVKNLLDLNIDNLTGTYNNQELSALIAFKYYDHNLILKNTNVIKLGKNIFKISATNNNSNYALKETEKDKNTGENSQSNSQNNTDYTFDLDIKNLKEIHEAYNGAISSSGKIISVNNKLTLSTIVTISKFALQNQTSNISIENASINGNISSNLEDELNISMSLKNANINDTKINKATLNIVGTILEHKITSNIDAMQTQIATAINSAIDNKQNKFNFFELKIKDISWVGNIDTLAIQNKEFGSWHNTTKPKLSLEKQSLFMDNLVMTAKLNNMWFNQGNAKFRLNENKLYATLDVSSNKADYIFADISIDNLDEYQAPSAQNITGSFNGKITNINSSVIKQVLPDVEDLTGNLETEGKIGGTISEPHFNSKTTAQNLKFSIPTLGLKINPLNITILGDKNGIFQVSGEAKTNNSSNMLYINGTVSPFAKTMPNKIHVKGNNIILCDLSDIKVTASPEIELKFKPQENSLAVDGKITIDKADINLESKHFASSAISSDVKYIGKKQTNYVSKKSTINIVPNIFVRITENNNISGFNLNGFVTGKVFITKKDDKYLGNGRITIKKGFYSFASNQYKISHGRLLYRPGTLLSNPKLDINMYHKDSFQSRVEKVESGHSGIYISGSLKSPKLELYSESQKSSDEVLKDMGLGGGANAMSGIANILNLSGGGFTDTIKSRFKLDEINLDSVTPNNYNTTKGDTVLVVGKKATDKLYVQYIKSVMKEKDSIQQPTNKMKLKYKINKNLNFGVEAGSDGVGGDLSFVVEK